MYMYISIEYLFNTNICKHLSCRSKSNFLFIYVNYTKSMKYMITKIVY